MADSGDIKEEEVKEEKSGEEPEKTDEKASSVSILSWIITSVVVVLCGGAGFALGRFLADSQTAKYLQEDKPAQVKDAEASDSAADSQKGWYYHLEPMVANLDVAGVTRYVRATLILEMSADMDEKKGTAFLDEKKPILTNWLAVYLASLSLDDIRGEMNLKKVQSQILDGFNEKLYPDSKPKIRRILFKEFAIQ